jgi:hypothetical protein
MRLIAGRLKSYAWSVFADVSSYVLVLNFGYQYAVSLQDVFRKLE